MFLDHYHDNNLQISSRNLVPDHGRTVGTELSYEFSWLLRPRPMHAHVPSFCRGGSTLVLSQGEDHPLLAFLSAPRSAPFEHTGGKMGS
jgi:hypothetical protein